MNNKKYNAILQRVRRDKFVNIREFNSVIKFLGGTIENGDGSSRKIILNGNIVIAHWHNENDFVRRDTWKALSLR